MDGNTAYAVLGVDTTVSADELKRAFRARARATHPDHGGRRGEFEAVLDAYRTLAQVVARHPRRPNPFFTETSVRPTWTASWVDETRWPRPRPRPNCQSPRPSFADVLTTAMATISPGGLV